MHLQNGANSEALAAPQAEVVAPDKPAPAIVPDRVKAAALRKDAALAIQRSDWPNAARLLSEFLALQPSDLRAQSQLTNVLFRQRRWNDALKSVAAELALAPDNGGAILKYLQTALRADRISHDELAAVARRALEGRFAIPGMLRMSGQALLVAGHPREAVDPLTWALAANPGDLSGYGLLARALEQSRDFLEAAKTLESRAQAFPDDPLHWRHAASAWTRAGDREKAAAAFRRSIEMRAGTFADDFETGLSSFPRLDVRLPQERFDWAYEIARAGGVASAQNPQDREAWTAQAQWGSDADQFLMDWLEIFPERWEDVARRISISGAEQLADALSAGRGAFVAIAHMGPVMAMPCAMMALGLPFAWVSGASAAGGGPIAERLISTKDLAPRDALAMMQQTLASGGALVSASDSETRGATSNFYGQEICVSETATYLAWREKAACFFLRGRWTEDRQITFDLEWLASPEAEESAEAFTSRWRSAYLDALHRALVTEPENLKLRGGFWHHVKARG